MEKQEVEKLILELMDERWSHTFVEERCPTCGHSNKMFKFTNATICEYRFRCIECLDVFSKEENLIKVK